jgi:hypothetical protein
MKKQKLKKIIKKNIVWVLFSFFIIWSVFWAFTSYLITTQSATELWSNNSIVSFTWSVWNEWYYVNDWDNSAIIWNYFTWYYYDSLFWFFKLDWSSNPNENVRISWSTSICSTWYWYKLEWKAYSEISWYIDFNYNSSTFVYYCLDDGKLHGTAYWKYIWYQDFEWIQVEVVNSVTDLTNNVSWSLFINDTTNINNSIVWWWWEEIIWWWTVLWWNVNQLIDTNESIFYIIK